MSSISSYSRLLPVPVTDEGKVLEMFSNLDSDSDIYVLRQDIGDETLLGFWAEDAVYWGDDKAPITEFLEKLRPFIKLGFATIYKEVDIILKDNGEVDFEAFAWTASRDYLTCDSLDDLPGDVQERFDTLLSKK